MPNPLNNLKGQQWDYCNQCDSPWWEGAFTFQKGLKVCPRCVDEIDIEQRDYEIGRALSAPTNEDIDQREYGVFFDEGIGGEI